MSAIGVVTVLAAAAAAVDAAAADAAAVDAAAADAAVVDSGAAVAIAEHFCSFYSVLSFSVLRRRE